MADTEIEKIFVDIIKHELSIANDYGSADSTNPNSSVIPSVIIGFQNIDLSNTDKLQIAVTLGSDNKFIANNNYTEFTDSGNTEIQEALVLETIQIDMFSKNLEARQRRWEVATAIASLYSKAQQEIYHFSIFKIPTSWINSSMAEAGSNLNRYTMTIPCHNWYRKSKPIVDYFDTFQGKITPEGSVVSSWSSSSTYDTDDEVLYEVDRKYYKCLNNGVTTVPTNATDWVEIATPSNVLDFTL